MLGVWWAGSEEDVIPAGDAAKGYVSAAFTAPGTDFPVMQDIKKKVYGAGKGNLEDPSRLGNVDVHARRRLRHHHRRGDAQRAGEVRQGQGDDAASRCAGASST